MNSDKLHISDQQMYKRKYASPKVDLVFKRVFGTEKNKDCLIAFLSDLLNFEIAALQFLNPEMPKDYAGIKGARLDVLVQLKSGHFVNVEIQVANQGNISQRSLYYWSRIYCEQLPAGEAYEVLKPVYGVYILDFEWFEKTNTYLQNYALRNTASGEKFDDQSEYLHLSFIELPKYKETATLPPKNLDKWILFFKTDNDAVLESLKMANPTIAKALSALEIATMTPEERRSYFARMAALSDEKSLVNYNLNKGIEIGIEKGIEKGKVETLQAGVKRLALKKFTHISEKALQQIESLESRQLEVLLDKIIELGQVQEFEQEVEVLNKNRA